MPDIVVITGEDAVLPCAAKSKEGVQYRSVIWYKVKFNICMYFIENLVIFVLTSFCLLDVRFA